MVDGKGLVSPLYSVDPDGVVLELRQYKMECDLSSIGMSHEKRSYLKAYEKLWMVVVVMGLGPVPSALDWERDPLALLPSLQLRRTAAQGEE